MAIKSEGLLTTVQPKAKGTFPAILRTNKRQEKSVNEEQVWLDQARQGDKVAFGKIIESFQRPVYNLAYRMLNNSGEAEEAAQEAFIRAYTRLESYNPNHKFSTWLLSITSNYCIDLIRKRRAILLSIDEPLPSHPSLMSEKSTAPESQIMQSQQQEMVQTLLSELAPEYREAVVLRYWHELSYDEIAEMMDTSVSAIKSRLFRARKQLAEVGIAAGLGQTADSVAVS
ncbi:RNA polymerase ECF-type sigma factor [hydrothermal vent metagenome]|uniref:RNA polymerase ECF-type sigma factor n=1 Tax=hydrothermal vent metagenome TaxID=652676 RepID=A0A3B0V3N2_9ZZZZ